MGMVITYRRTGGVLALLGLVAGLMAIALTVAVGATLLIIAVAIGFLAFVVRAVLPTPWRRRVNAPATPWPHETIEATIVNPPGSSDERDLLRLDSDQG